MYYPTKQEFIKLAKKGNLIPVFRELLADLETPVSAFMKIDCGKYSYLLESVEGQEKIARYSFMGSSPSLVIKYKKKKFEIYRRTGSRFDRVFLKTTSDPLAEIKKVLNEYRFVPVEGLPRFCGGLVGYLGYDTVRFFEKIPDKNADDLKVADAVFMLTDTILIFDHIAHKIKVVSVVHLDEKIGCSKAKAGRAYEAAVKKIEKLTKKLNQPLVKQKKSVKTGPLKIHFNMKKAAFKKIVLKAKNYIRAGDIIQVVLSQRLRINVGVSPLTLYRALRTVNPSPYMYYLNCRDVKLIGASPEVMVRCENNIVNVRPIAGTRPRGKCEKDDKILSQNLLNDPKEIAEHIMLLDLGRNDLGRVCRWGSVKVKELMQVERYSHVMHIVSDVQGQLKKDKDIFDVIRATFPAGTVTGAPKVRAMEIIDELENTRRGPYAGCVGYFSFSGNLDACITIRTIVLKGKTAYVQAGAGIVADS
ncbi:MAG: anthranilate synthase component I, partial [Candidatus Omnitrophica bacterium]|nr:anthranilate synthase component I [Candidatus Omnitrophota bacterium]